MMMMMTMMMMMMMIIYFCWHETCKWHFFTVISFDLCYSYYLSLYLSVCMSVVMCHSLSYPIAITYSRIAIKLSLRDLNIPIFSIFFSLERVLNSRWNCRLQISRFGPVFSYYLNLRSTHSIFINVSIVTISSIFNYFSCCYSTLHCYLIAV